MRDWQNSILKEFSLMQRKAALYYVLPLFREAMGQIKSLESPGVTFLFPVKSFSHPTILKEVADRYSGFDVSNKVEYDQVAPFLKKEQIIWNSSPINEKISDVNYNDLNTMGALEDCNFSGCSVRINPTFMGVENRFGISPEKAIAYLKTHPSVDAIHVHLSGIQNSRDDFTRMIENVRKIAQTIQRSLKINLGGGFSQLGFEDLKFVVDVAKIKLSGHELFFEPGRWLAKQSGFAVGRVLGLEETRMSTSLSAACHLRWMDTDCKISFNKSLAGTDTVTHKIYGPTCFENDLIGGVSIPRDRIQAGDIIFIDKISGYAFGWNHAFNGVPAADIVFLGG